MNADSLRLNSDEVQIEWDGTTYILTENAVYRVDKMGKKTRIHFEDLPEALRIYLASLQV